MARTLFLLLALLLGAMTGRAGEDPGNKKKAPAVGSAEDDREFPIRAPALGIAGSIRFPGQWNESIERPSMDFSPKDPEIRRKFEAAAKKNQLPNPGFAASFDWNNTGDVLAIVRLALGCEKYPGTARKLADRCIAEIRARWPSLKEAKPKFREAKTASHPALYVTLENCAEPPYRVHFAVVIVEGKGCALFCYGWGPQVELIDLSGGEPLPGNVRKLMDALPRLSTESLRMQESLFHEFETRVVPSLRLGRPAAETAKPDPTTPPAR